MEIHSLENYHFDMWLFFVIDEKEEMYLSRTFNEKEADAYFTAQQLKKYRRANKRAFLASKAEHSSVF